MAAKNRDWRNLRHFFAIAASAMRRYQIDHVLRDARLGVVTLLGVGVERLHGADGHKARRVVQSGGPKYWLGLNDEDSTEALGMKLRSMQRIGRDARHRLFERADS
jgi:hypothetical protein